MSQIKEPVFGSQIKVATIRKKGEKPKPKVLLIHGLSERGMEDWVKVVPALVEGYDLVTLDLPGFGESEQPRGKYTPKAYAQILHEVKKKVAPKDKWYVMGYSMGGAIAIRYAELYPKEVEAMVLISVAGILERTTYLKHTIFEFLDKDESSEKYQSFISMMKRPIGKLIEAINGLPDPTKLVKDEGIWKKLFSGHQRFNAGMALIEEDFSKAILECQHPTTVIWGDQDKIAPLRTGKLLASSMPNAQLFLIEGAGHAPMTSHGNLLHQHVLSGLEKSPSKAKKYHRDFHDHAMAMNLKMK